MKGFGIEIKNNLLETKHVEKMGIAVWLYFWFLDKMTSISEQGIGKVLGGKPIVYGEVQVDLGISEHSYRRWVANLKKHGYINVIRTPHGLSISVNKAYKRFGKKVRKLGQPCEWCGRRNLALANHHYPISREDGGTKTVLICVVCHAIFHSTGYLHNHPIYSESRDMPQMQYEQSEVAYHSNKSGISNKTDTVDSNSKTYAQTSFEAFWKEYPRKVAKKKAQQSWDKIKPGEPEMKKIMAALAAVKRSAQWLKDDGQFIPHPATWLNQERFNDELPGSAEQKTVCVKCKSTESASWVLTSKGKVCGKCFEKG